MDGNLKRLRIVEDVRSRIKLRECNVGSRVGKVRLRGG